MPISVASPPRTRRLGAPLRSLVRTTLAEERRRAGEIGVVLSRDEVLRDLNRRYRSIDRATDVLSFGYGAEPDGRVSGDLVISLDRVAAQARRYRVRPGRELARLVVHGVLHLAGHDHHRPEERRLMRRAEARALRAGARAVAALEAAVDHEATLGGHSRS